MKSKRRKFTAEEYLAFERRSQFKHEFLDGYIYRIGEWSVTHDSPLDHDAIVSAVFKSLLPQLRSFGREIYSSLDKVSSPCQLNFNRLGIPDVMVTCAMATSESFRVDAQRIPELVAEVLSDSTEMYDRGKKFEHCRQIESLREYALISQDRAHVELFTKGDDGVWSLSEATGLEATISLPTIGCKLALADVYAKVSWAS